MNLNCSCQCADAAVVVAQKASEFNPRTTIEVALIVLVILLILIGIIIGLVKLTEDKNSEEMEEDGKTYY